MRRIVLNIAAVSGALIMLAGCKKDLVETPRAKVEVNQYFTTLKDVNAAVAGAYASFQIEMIGDGASAYGGKYHYWGEARSDNFDRSQYPGTIMPDLALNQLTSLNSTADWAGLYRTLNRVNYAIANIPRAAQLDNNVTPTIRDNNLAQCYALRAMCYFYLVRVWGDAVVWTEPYLDTNKPDQVPRTSKDKIINDLILPDLTKAYTLIQKNQTPNVWFIGEGAICSIAADVCMWKKDYPTAITWIQNLFKAKSPTGAVYAGTSGANLETTANWKNNFLAPTGSIEPIWSIFWDNATDGCACIPVSSMKNNNPIRVDSVFAAKWKVNYKTDTRVAKVIDTLPGTGHVDKIYKYYNFPSIGIPATVTDVTTLNVYLPMYRLGGMYLMYAEALNYNGDKTNALKYLNYVRVRAGLPALLATDPSIATTESMEDVILQERQYELFGEGVRWFDLVRTGRVKTVMDPIVNYRFRRIDPASTANWGTDMNKVLWPILRQNLEDNKQLVQNPSYF